MASTYHLLEKAERIELLAEQLYRALAGRFAGDAKALFLRLAEEEAQHAARIRLLTARYRQDKRLVTTLATDTTQLDLLIGEAEQALAAVGAGTWDGDPAGALRSAAALEERFCQVHAQALSQDAHPELRAFFEQLAVQDRAHADLLGSQDGPFPGVGGR